MFLFDAKKRSEANQNLKKALLQEFQGIIDRLDVSRHLGICNYAKAQATGNDGGSDNTPARTPEDIGPVFPLSYGYLHQNGTNI